MNWISKFIVKWSLPITIVGTALTIVSGYYTVKLYKNLNTQLIEMLPTETRSVKDVQEVVSRVQGTENIAVITFSDDIHASKRFVDDFAKEMIALKGKGLISLVEYKIDEELAFFSARRPLYMDEADLVAIRDYVDDRIHYEKELHNPLNIFRTIELPEPILDFVEMEKKYASKSSAFTKFPRGYYATPDEKVRIVMVYLVAEKTEMDGAMELNTTIRSTIARLNPTSYAPDLTVKYSGGAQNMVEEHEALVEDLALSTIIVVVLTAIFMLTYFKTFRATAALLISLFMGTFWTFGAAYFIVGYLNANSAFLGAIVIGNGINFGIIFLARYMEDRRAHRGHIRAINSALVNTATATWVAALAAGLAYGSLVLTSFRGFNQFGRIGLVGMILCWLSAFTMLPALLTLIDRYWPMKEKATRAQKHLIAGALARLIGRRPKLLWTISYMLTIASLMTLVLHDGEILESNLSKLRNKKSMESGSGYNTKYIDEVFGRDLSPVAILAHSRKEAYEIADILNQRKKEEGEKSLISGIRSMKDFVPENQWTKIKTLKEIRNLIYPDLINRLAPTDRALANELLNNSAFNEIREETLPTLIQEKFREKDGSMGKVVLVEPVMDSESWSTETLNRFIRELRDVGDSVGGNAPVAGALAVTSDMMESILHDGPRATLFAFLAVVFLVIFLFRNVRTIALVLFALLIGMTWLLGIVLGFDLKINFLNFIALPITFGIGVDYGVNVFHRYRQEGKGSILSVIENTGGAVLLASLTTTIGYGSLVIASNQAFVSFGWLAVLGELTTVLAAIISLPAYLVAKEQAKVAD